MKKALVTGGSRGIGKAVCAEFLRHGFEVDAPARAELDLFSAASIEAFLESRRGVAYDAIVNNAGINDVHPIEEITDAEIERMLAVDLVAPIRLLRGLVPAMKQNGGGRVVNVGSIWAVVSKPGRTVYSAAKNGVHGLTNTLAVELAPYGILVNTLCPGFTLTELTRKNNTPSQMAAICGAIPLGRMAEPHEIAKAVYFLCSEENTYITGQKLTVDGGFTVQ